MREVVKLPPLSIWPDRDTTQSWRYLEAQTPIDFTQTLNGVGYTAEILIIQCDEVAWRAPLLLGAQGYLTATIPESVGLDLSRPERIDAHYQINLNSPVPEQSQVWTGPVTVYEVYQ